MRKTRKSLLVAGVIALQGCSLDSSPSTPVTAKPVAQTPYSTSPAPATGDVKPATPAAAKPNATADGKVTFLAQIKYSSILKAIQNDALSVSPGDQSKTRYFTLQVPSNAGLGSDSLDVQRAAFKKAINSMSTKSSLVQPTAIDADKIVYRVNLDDLNIDAATFDQVMTEHYPFSQTFEDIGDTESITNQQIDATIRGLLKTNNYAIRMDWFNATAPLPILYAKLVGIPQNLSDFEEQTIGGRVSVASITAANPAAAAKLNPALIINEGGVAKVDRRIANIIQDQVVRTGFDNSNVSFSNRMVEHHTISDGSYWISYDFFNLKLNDVFTNAQGITKNAEQADLDEHNINKSPLGPKGTNGGSLEFNHDGGEVIYSLPNGLFGYYLINAAGTLLDKGPINVVRQNSAPPEMSLAITNGLSCMSCHNAGLLKQSDSILLGIGQNKALIGSADLARINKIYNPTEFNRLIDKENARYTASLSAIGIDSTKPDPVDLTFRFYNRPLTKKDVLAELDITDRDFSLLLLDPQFSGIFNALNNETGFINRGVFQAIYPSVIAKFKQDVLVTPPAIADFVVTQDCMFVDPVQMDNCTITPVALTLKANK